MSQSAKNYVGSQLITFLVDEPGKFETLSVNFTRMARSQFFWDNLAWLIGLSALSGFAIAAAAFTWSSTSVRSEMAPLFLLPVLICVLTLITLTRIVLLRAISRHSLVEVGPANNSLLMIVNDNVIKSYPARESSGQKVEMILASQKLAIAVADGNCGLIFVCFVLKDSMDTLNISDTQKNMRAYANNGTGTLQAYEKLLAEHVQPGSVSIRSALHGNIKLIGSDK
jgi:hypothetical protein